MPSINDRSSYIENATQFTKAYAHINQLLQQALAAPNNPPSWAEEITTQISTLEKVHIPALARSIQSIAMDGNFTQAKANEIYDKGLAIGMFADIEHFPIPAEELRALILEDEPVGDHILSLKARLEAYQPVIDLRPAPPTVLPQGGILNTARRMANSIANPIAIAIAATAVFAYRFFGE